MLEVNPDRKCRTLQGHIRSSLPSYYCLVERRSVPAAWTASTSVRPSIVKGYGRLALVADLAGDAGLGPLP